MAASNPNLKTGVIRVRYAITVITASKARATIVAKYGLLTNENEKMARKTATRRKLLWAKFRMPIKPQTRERPSPIIA